MAFTQSDAAHTSSRWVRSPQEPDLRHRFVFVQLVKSTTALSSLPNELKMEAVAIFPGKNSPL